MGSAAAGKFQDHYKLLGIDPKSSPDVIQLAYNALADLYKPGAKEANTEKFAAINLALEVLLDPAARKMFDAVRGGEDEREVTFSGLEFFSSLVQERDRRMTMLCVLYDVRRQNPRVPVVTMRQFEKIVDMTEDQIQLCLWYLKTLGWITVDDKSKMQITASGMDFLESNSPDPARIWPYLKSPTGPAPEAATPSPAQDLSALSAALSAAPPPPPPPTLATPPPRPTISVIRRPQISITEA